MVKYEIRNNIAHITMDFYEKRNALNPSMVSGLKKAFLEASNNLDINIITLTGTNDVFSAGADLDHLEKLNEFSFEENLKDSSELKDLFYLIYTCKKPVVGILNGHAIAGGAGLASVCDIVIAKESIKIGYTEVKIGFIAAIVMVFLKRLIGNKSALELLLSGRLIGSSEAKSLGLVSHVYNDIDFEKETELYLKNMSKNSPNSLIETKQMFNSLGMIDLEEELNMAAKFNANFRKTEECKEGIRAFLEKRQPSWLKK